MKLFYILLAIAAAIIVGYLGTAFFGLVWQAFNGVIP